MRVRVIGAVMEFLYRHVPESRLRGKALVRLRDWAWKAEGR